jgi:GNAT superfamily N-acetyltransferase
MQHFPACDESIAHAGGKGAHRFARSRTACVAGMVARVDAVPPSNAFRILPATPDDVPEILAMIQALADYERLRDLCIATESSLKEALFGSQPAAEVVLGWEDARPVAFALYFHNFSTFLGRRGLYLEDLFVRPPFRGRGYGRALLVHLARIAVARGCGRFEWAVLDWNSTAIGFYESLGATLLPDWRITRVTGGALERLAASPVTGL